MKKDNVFISLDSCFLLELLLVKTVLRKLIQIIIKYTLFACRMYFLVQFIKVLIVWQR